MQKYISRSRPINDGCGMASSKYFILGPSHKSIEMFLQLRIWTPVFTPAIDGAGSGPQDKFSNPGTFHLLDPVGVVGHGC